MTNPSSPKEQSAGHDSSAGNPLGTTAMDNDQTEAFKTILEQISQLRIEYSKLSTASGILAEAQLLAAKHEELLQYQNKLEEETKKLKLEREAFEKERQFCAGCWTKLLPSCTTQNQEVYPQIKRWKHIGKSRFRADRYRLPELIQPSHSSLCWMPGCTDLRLAEGYFCNRHSTVVCGGGERWGPKADDYLVCWNQCPRPIDGSHWAFCDVHKNQRFWEESDETEQVG